MRACILTVVNFPALIEIPDNKPLYFAVKGRPVAIVLEQSHKGVSIWDTKNQLVAGTGKTMLNSRLGDFKNGYVMRVVPVNADGKSTPELELIQALHEFDGIRDVFVVENYYTTMKIWVEFDNFLPEVFEDDKKRDSYNRSVVKVIEHFATQYNLNLNSTILDTQAFNFKEPWNSYLFRQTYFEMPKGKTLEDFFAKTMTV